MNGKVFIITCAALMLMAVILFVSVISPGAYGDTAQTSGSVNASEIPETYTVKSCGDKIGIFTDGGCEPIKTIPVNPQSLPAEARELLDKGITVSSRSELMLLIEDYIS